MRNAEFRRLLGSLERLTPRQRQSLRAALEPDQVDPEAQLPEPEACPHCEGDEVIRWGRARGRQRWRCKACRRTFSRFTNTPREGLRYRERWAEFAGALLDGATVHEIAERCGISASTAHRWRTRFLQGLVAVQEPLEGIAEADETYLLRSAKGQPAVRLTLGRPPRRRGGTATRRGLSREQVPILMVKDRSGSVASRVTDPFNADAARALLEGVLAEDAILCTDGHGAYRVAAERMNIQHEAVVHARGERVRGAFHIQNANNLHSRFKAWLRRFNGVSTSRLPLYVAWFNRIVQIEAKDGPRKAALRRMLAT